MGNVTPEPSARRKPNRRPSRAWLGGDRLIRVVILLLAVTLTGAVVAGGGPETTLVVVNGDSSLSLRIANAYVHLRDIPATHVVWVHEVPSQGTISIDTFRKQIWKPIRDHITAHGLDDEIDLITYSADFPYAVDFSSDIQANKLPKNRYRGKVASLTGLTYFARHVETGSTGYLGENHYFRRNLAAAADPLRAFSTSEQNLDRRAKKAFKKKEYQAAVEAYGALTRRYSTHGGTWHNLARSLAALGKPDEAMEALSKAVETGWSNSRFTRNDRFLKSLRDRPGFEALLAQMEVHNGPFEPAQGFRSRYLWNRTTLPLGTMKSLDRYYLSTLLAYTGERGNSVAEVLSYLRSAAASDGTKPTGTVYLLENPNIRSVTRQPLFLATVAALAERGRRAEILTKNKDGQKGIIPLGKDDVVGAVVGAARFDWAGSKSRFLPGAIAESLTSYGGDFRKAKQTKLSEFLRYGAAGSSGAVAEPFSIQAKFPVSLLHVYYADGCSLAEAFYQSVLAPYQLIVVGDPLARPFAQFAHVALDAPDPAQPWQGRVNIRPILRPAAKRPIGRVELWVDGRHVADARPGKPIPWDTGAVEDGSHELRLVAVEAGRIETRSFARVTVTVANTRNRVHVDDGNW